MNGGRGGGHEPVAAPLDLKPGLPQRLAVDAYGQLGVVPERVNTRTRSSISPSRNQERTSASSASRSSQSPAGSPRGTPARRRRRDGGC